MMSNRILDLSKIVTNNQNVFLYEDIKNDLCKKMGIVFGNGIRLFAYKANANSPIEYPSFFIKEQKLFNVNDVVKSLEINEDDVSIYHSIKNHIKLDEHQKTYLKVNYFKER